MATGSTDLPETDAGSPAAVSGLAAEPEVEPVLDIDRIQGHVLVGFERAAQAAVFVRMADPGSARGWLRDLGARCTTAAEVLSTRVSPSRGTRIDGSEAGPWLAVAFSFSGLEKIDRGALAFRDPAFKAGMYARAHLLGDPRDPGSAGNPANWVVGGPNAVPDALLLIADERREAVERAIDAIVGPPHRGIRILHVDFATPIDHPRHPREHFGFRDSLSQPGLRGRLPFPGTPFFTSRRNGADPNHGWPGQELVWPGEFVFGYAGQDPTDRHKPGPVTNAGPGWAQNGSFLVVRRLRQDVEAFAAFLERARAELRRRSPAFSDLTIEALAAKLMGRWRSGAPVVRAPAQDDELLARDPCARNHFAFLSNGAETSPPEGRGEGRGMGAPADPEGLSCPQAAHIRRAYPRDSTTPQLTRAKIETHRLLRRAIPYGKRYPAADERGLLFMAYMTSFERQFEFVTRAWLNNPNFPFAGTGQDPIVGQRFGASDRTRSFRIPYRDESGAVTSIQIRLERDWVIPTGGGYFFAPAIDVLEELGRREP